MIETSIPAVLIAAVALLALGIILGAVIMAMMTLASEASEADDEAERILREMERGRRHGRGLGK